jgi:5S rRNA maturation endonuclease (ribonuclease M5)
MKMGTDLIIIEKQGAVEVFGPFADRNGIALLNTRGFLTEYAIELSKLAEQHKCNIAILTDLDSSGLIISTKIPNVYRLGVDIDTLFELELYKEDVEEEVGLEKKNWDLKKRTGT